ncbi:peptide ABC transporter substrate-binding protein [Fodinisporobacter ferrooxydans]|uniref:Peptide ABC transporter substrate-binding protein n=1 Tax=Fodinisporobacter ferrooxydans TaxID=2901836 RepID=A0ABY4CLB2_9BACL|nr:peptide ABC transporter substrate-binding protein [Alicyclobacillaceae bacterium MYW30-H2]
MKKKYLYKTLGGFLATSVLLTGCGGGAAAGTAAGSGGSSSGKQSVSLDLITEPPTLDPAMATDTTSDFVINAAFEGLTHLGSDNKPVPGIAESWSTSQNGTVWTFKLRDAKWSNGDPVTANDFVYAWKHILNPKTGAQFANYLYYIKGAKEYNTNKGSADQVAVKAIDDHTLQVTLNTPVPFFLDLTAFHPYFPVDQKVVEKNPKWAADASTIVSDGPFKVASWQHQQKLVLQKNQNYWDKNSIKLDQVTGVIVNDLNTQYQMFKSGQLDMDVKLPATLTPKLLQSGEAKIYPLAGTYMLEFNTQKKPFDNVNIRKALSLAIDRQSLVKDVTQQGETPAYAFVPPGDPGKNGDFRKEGGDLFKDDVAQAKQLLAQGLKEEGLSQLPPITYQYNTVDYNKKIAEAIQQMWKKNLGVDVTLQNEDWKIYLDKLTKGDFQIGRMGWIQSYTDPSAELDLLKSDFGSNYTRWKNKQFDKYVNEAETTTDVSKRMDDMHKADQLIIDQAPVAPLFFYTNVFAFNKKIDGIVVHPSDTFPDVRYMSVK